MINDIRLDRLLKKLDRDTIKKIHNDDLLNKDSYKDLFIANASKKLFTPNEEHQLFSKGIVYDKDFNLVSLPLVKIYNLGEKENGDRLAKKLPLSEVPEKWDGTMIQIFEHNGETIYTTRSRFFTDQFCDWAQEIMNEMYPAFKPEPGFSYVFELIHPDNRIITDYGDLKDMVLLSVFDVKNKMYLPMSVIRNKYDQTLNVVANLFHGDMREVEKKVRALSDGTEGVVLVFEDDEKVLHRTKVKADYYVELFRMKFACTYKNVKPVLLTNPDLHDWDSFWQFNKDTNTFAEELEGFLREYFDRFMAWKEQVDDVLLNAQMETEEFLSGFEPEWVKEFPDLKYEVDVEEACRAYSKVPNRNNLVFLGIRGRLNWEAAAKQVEDKEDE
jgi:hypothetical protein